MEQQELELELDVTAEEVKPVDPEKKPTILIATPMYGGMCTGHYVMGLLGTINKMREFGVQVYWSQIMNESLITRARNALVQMFLERDIDYLMFVDADISFDALAVAQLMAADRDIACGVYPKKEIDWGQIERAAAAGYDGLRDYAGSFVLNGISAESEPVDEDGMIEVRHGGTGFMLIKRRVFEIMKPHVRQYRISSVIDKETKKHIHPLTYEFFATSIDHNDTLLSEDYHFCELWRKLGGKVYVNPFIKLEHVGTHVFSGDIIKSGGNLK